MPDSLLKEFCKYIDQSLSADQHIIASNEGAAISIATGVQISTGQTPLVYLQNSGLGNTINPLMSLVDPEVYSIPMILMIGWRGKPGISDEPQHVKQGRVTPDILKAMEIPYKVLSDSSDNHNQVAGWAVNESKKTNGPVVLLVEKNTFEKLENKKSVNIELDTLLAREEVINLLTKSFTKDYFFISSTGKISRELYESRDNRDQDHSRDFLTVGSMGYSSQIAYGIAIKKPHTKIICLDGDGALLMHMGGMTTIGTSNLKNYNHIILNNGVHDSVGGQPTLGFDVDFCKIADACNYKNVFGPLKTETEISNALIELSSLNGPNFIDIRVKPGARADLGRPKSSPIENKKLFIEKLNN